MKQSNPQAFTIDLSKVEGKGDFPCPGCGVVISPDDMSDTVYAILETKVNGDSLEELTIQCNKCGSKIRLTGFLPQN
jgi:ribosomal protein S27AE